MIRKMLMLTVLATLAVPAMTLQAQEASWIHLRVDEDDVTQVRLNLPMSMVALAVESIRTGALAEASRNGGDGGDVSLEDARMMWLAMREAGDAEFVDVRDGDERMRVFREGDRVFIHGDEGDTATLRIEMPVELADALLAEDLRPGELEAAIQALVERGESELMLIRDQDATVRLWADDRSTQD